MGSLIEQATKHNQLKSGQELYNITGFNNFGVRIRVRVGVRVLAGNKLVV